MILPIPYRLTHPLIRPAPVRVCQFVQSDWSDHNTDAIKLRPINFASCRLNRRDEAGYSVRETFFRMLRSYR